ncbi:MAG: type I methionyl aminopeptidase [Bacteriovoracaceae bacterium]|nr:type I methionyl aminopeptidase [Bacteriovoracaceae bacterium]
MISIKSAREIALMKEACQLASRTLDHVEKFLVPGISTLEVNDICHEFIIKHGGIPSCLNYNGFPKSICTSLNNVICHGIPNKNDIAKDGDILNVDVTAYLNGFHGDTNRTFHIGIIKPENKKLVDVTYDCMMAAINLVKPGVHLGDLGAVIQEIAEANGYSVVREYCGHGIGREFHEDPQVLHYGNSGTGLKLKAGMTFTIEPMINLGKRHCKVLSDEWTVVTVDGKNSAQFEHTILVTESGHEILTVST